MIFHKKTLRFPYKNLFSLEYATAPINFKETQKRINDFFSPEHYMSGLTNVLMVEQIDRTNTVENAIVCALFKCAQIKSRKKDEGQYIRVDGEKEIPYWPYTDVTPKDLKEEVKEQMDDAMLAETGLSPGMKAKVMLDVEDEYEPNDEDEGQPDEGGLS